MTYSVYTAGFPKAIAYMLGAYGLPMIIVEKLYRSKDSQEIGALLGYNEYTIDTNHSDWTRDEIYYRGMDLVWCIQDHGYKDDLTRFMFYPYAERKDIVKSCIKELDHDSNLIQNTLLLSRHINNLYEEHTK